MQNIHGHDPELMVSSAKLKDAGTEDPGNFTETNLTEQVQSRPHLSLEFVNANPLNELDTKSKKQIRSKASRYTYDNAQYAHHEKQSLESSVPRSSHEPHMALKKFRIDSQGLQEKQVKVRRKSHRKSRDAPTKSGESLKKKVKPATLENVSIPERQPEHLSIQHNPYEITFPSEGDGIRTVQITPIGLDPFDTFPLSCCPEEQRMIHHYFTTRPPSSLLMRAARKGWFTLAIQDAAFFRVAMSHYAAYYHLAHRNEGDKADALIYRMKAISIVDSRLEEPGGGVDDGTIGAVACIVNCEAAHGTILSVKVHVNGLVNMIKIRGGIEKAGFSKTLQRIIAWADIGAASMLETQPKILPYHEILQTPPLSIIETQSTPSLCIPGLQSYQPDINIILRQVRNLITYFKLNMQQPGRLEIFNDIAHSDRLYSIRRSLHYIQTHPNLAHLESQKFDIPLALAASIFLDSCLRDMGFRVGIICILVTRLKRVLLAADAIISETEDLADLMFIKDDLRKKRLCTLAIGTVAAIGKDERPWFAMMLAKACEEMQIGSLIELEMVLEEVIWMDGWESPPGMMWMEVQYLLQPLGTLMFEHVP